MLTCTTQRMLVQALPACASASFLVALVACLVYQHPGLKSGDPGLLRIFLSAFCLLWSVFSAPPNKSQHTLWRLAGRSETQNLTKNKSKKKLNFKSKRVFYFFGDFGDHFSKIWR